MHECHRLLATGVPMPRHLYEMGAPQQPVGSFDRREYTFSRKQTLLLLKSAHTISRHPPPTRTHRPTHPHTHDCLPATTLPAPAHALLCTSCLLQTSFSVHLRWRSYVICHAFINGQNLKLYPKMLPTKCVKSDRPILFILVPKNSSVCGLTALNDTSFSSKLHFIQVNRVSEAEAKPLPVVVHGWLSDLFLITRLKRIG